MQKLPNKQPDIQINLLPQDPFINGIFGKFLTWSLSIGRYIVVLTELVVILSFLSRFQLDRKLTDLNEEIENQKSIILSYSQMETEFRDTQTKIDFLKKELQNENLLDSMTYLEKNIPIDVKLESLTLQPTGLTLTASALSAQGMKATVDKVILLNPKSDASLGTVKINSRTGTIDFDINLKTKQVASKKVTPTTEDTDSTSESLIQ